MSVRKRMERVKLPPAEGVHAPSGGESGSEEEEEEWMECGVHPLLNDLILETLFGFVRRWDLKACRVVSKMWNLHSIPHMRATFRVTIRQNLPNRTIYDFVKLFSSNELGIPFSKFKLEPFSTTDGVREQFLHVIGETATEIDLNTADMSTSTTYGVEDVRELLRSCPNLKVFGFPYDLSSSSGSVVKLFPDSIPTFPSLHKITFNTHFAPMPLTFCPSAIVEMVTASPNIREIVVHVFDQTFAIPFDENEIDRNISDVLNTIETLGRESSVQSLDIHDARISHAHQLCRMGEKKNGLKLKSLSFAPRARTADNFDDMELKLAGLFKNTLQDLDLHAFGPKLMELPSMPQLKSLIIKVSSNSYPHAVDLTHKFPVLERLKIIYFFDIRNDQKEFLTRFYVCPTIKSLRLEHSNLTLHAYHSILRVFPSLTQLDFRVGKDAGEILRRVWIQMTGLESLSISIIVRRARDLDLDSLFTGIPTRALHKNRHYWNGLERMSVQGRRKRILRLTAQHSELPSIRNLTKLRHLYFDATIGFGNERYPSYPSDVTAYLAFHSMNRLNHLHVKRCAFTKTCCEILRVEKGLESWSFGDRERGNIIPPFALMEQETHQ